MLLAVCQGELVWSVAVSTGVLWLCWNVLGSAFSFAACPAFLRAVPCLVQCRGLLRFARVHAVIGPALSLYFVRAVLYLVLLS